MKKTSVSIIGTVGVPASYGGFETMVDYVIDGDHRGHELIVYCSSKDYDTKVSHYKNAQLKYIPVSANGLQSALYDAWSIWHSVVKRYDNLLLLGVTGAAIFLPFVRWFSRAKIISNIDGLEWNRDKWNKLLQKYIKFSESMMVRFSDVIIADNQAIADYVQEEYGKSAEVIAYGGDHAVDSELQISDQGYALALCRIEPENNVELILKSFSQTNKPLKFVGNWDKSDFSRRLKAEYSKFPNIEILDPIYDVAKLQVLRQECSYYVHGHMAGGTNPSLVEMMHFGKIILAYDCVFNRKTTEEQAHFFIDEKELVEQINHAGLSDNGSVMKEIAKRHYTWQIIKEQYFSLFK
jgi:glycosyltransferase involved in cell wall biosynthesis